MKQELLLVFSDRRYVVLSSAIFALLFLALSIMSEYIFLEPYVVGHIPNGMEIGFGLILGISVLAALVLPMNVYRINVLRNSKKKMSGGLFGSIIGAAAGACSCGPVGFAIVSTFGSIGGTAIAFLTNYEIPLRLVAIAILGFVYVSTIKSLRIECKLEK